MTARPLQIVLGLLFALAPGSPLGAQPALDQVEELIAQGRVSEARQTLEE